MTTPPTARNSRDAVETDVVIAGGGPTALPLHAPVLAAASTDLGGPGV